MVNILQFENSTIKTLSNYTAVLYIQVFRPEPHSLRPANLIHIYLKNLNKS